MGLVAYMAPLVLEACPRMLDRLEGWVSPMVLRSMPALVPEAWRFFLSQTHQQPVRELVSAS